MRAAVEIIVWSAVLLGIGVVSISSVTPVELAVASTAAVCGGFVARRVRLAAGTDLRGGRGAIRAVVALPFAVVRGTVVLVAALVKHPDEATLRLLRLEVGTDASWAGALIAASPDSCVVEVPSRDEVLLHALKDDAGPVERALTRPSEGSR